MKPSELRCDICAFIPDNIETVKASDLVTKYTTLKQINESQCTVMNCKKPVEYVTWRYGGNTWRSRNWHTHCAYHAKYLMKNGSNIRRLIKNRQLKGSE